MRCLRVHLCLVLLVSCVSRAHADGILISWSPNQIEGMTEARWDQAKDIDAAASLEGLRTARDWATVYEINVAAGRHATDKAWLNMIAGEITNPAETKLEGTSRLIARERIRSGDVLFEGEGMQVDDDRFRVAGRANWILRTRLKKNFGTVGLATTRQELDALRGKWQAYLAGKPVQEEPNPYPSNTKDLSELRSPAAIEGLIWSLHPNPAKDRATKACLGKLYGVDTMPTALDASERLCDPDTFAHQFLGIITDVPDPHPQAWWEEWWKQRGHSLRWDPKKARFASTSP